MTNQNQSEIYGAAHLCSALLRTVRSRAGSGGAYKFAEEVQVQTLGKFKSGGNVVSM